MLCTIEIVAVARTKRANMDKTGREECLMRKATPRRISAIFIYVNSMVGHRVWYENRKVYLLYQE